MAVGVKALINFYEFCSKDSELLIDGWGEIATDPSDFSPHFQIILQPNGALDVLKRRYAHLVGLIIFEEKDPLEFLYFGADRWNLTKTLWNDNLDVMLYQCFLTRIGSNYDPFNETDTKVIEQEVAN